MASIKKDEQLKFLKTFERTTLSTDQLYWAVSCEWMSDFKIHTGLNKGQTTKKFPRRINQSSVPELNCFVPWFLWKEVANWYGLESMKETIPYGMVNRDKNVHVMINVAKVLKDGKLSEPEPFIINIHQAEWYLHFQLHHQMNVSRNRSSRSRLLLTKQMNTTSKIDGKMCKALSIASQIKSFSYLQNSLMQLPGSVSTLRTQSPLASCLILNRLLKSLIDHKGKVCEKISSLDMMDAVVFNTDDFKEVQGGIIIEEMEGNKWPSGLPHPCDAINRYHYNDIYSVDIECKKISNQVKTTTLSSGYVKPVTLDHSYTPPKADSVQYLHCEKVLNEVEKFQDRLSTNIDSILTSSSKKVTKSIQDVQISMKSRQAVLDRRSDNLKLRKRELIQKEQTLDKKLGVVNTKKEILATNKRQNELKAKELQDEEAEIQDREEKLLKRESKYKDEIHTGDSSTLSEKVHLNVGGREFETTTRTLTSISNSLLADLFKPGSEFRNNDNQYFLDRDGELFSYIVKYLRIGKDVVELLPKNPILLKELELEAKFFGLQEMRELVTNVLKR